MEPSTPGQRRRAIEVSIDGLNRLLLLGMSQAAIGVGNLWHIRRQANKDLVSIFGQLAQLSAAVSPVAGAAPRRKKGRQRGT